MKHLRTWTMAMAALLMSVSACSTSSDATGNGNDDDPAANVDAGPGGGGEEEEDPFGDALAEREVDYFSALRIAALRLTGDLPTLQEIKNLQGATDIKSAYEAQIQAYISDPRFAETQVEFWQNTFKMGGSQELNSAGVFAAQLVVEGRSYLELLTATTGTCPTFDGTNFTAQDCDNGVAVHAGLLSHPGMMAHFYSNMAFRRVRWAQETFACTTFPTESAEAPEQLSDTAVYTTPWPFESIASLESGGQIDFLDYESVVCANCHATMNHMAPLFGNFDENGQLTGEISVVTPVEGSPNTTLSDWLPEGEVSAWRFGTPTPDLPALGAAMAADPAIAECAVARAWNWAMGKGDIVDTLSTVPSEVFQEQLDEFVNNDYDFKTLTFRVFTSEDFIRF